MEIYNHWRADTPAQGWSSQHNPFDLTDGDLVAAAVVQLGGGAEAWPAMYCAFSSAPPLLRNAVPAARKVWQQVVAGTLKAAATGCRDKKF
jgi:hypothetical protein